MRTVTGTVLPFHSDTHRHEVEDVLDAAVDEERVLLLERQPDTTKRIQSPRFDCQVVYVMR